MNEAAARRGVSELRILLDRPIHLPDHQSRAVSFHGEGACSGQRLAEQLRSTIGRGPFPESTGGFPLAASASNVTVSSAEDIS